MKAMLTKALVLVLSCFALLSFTVKPGGEGFEVFLNNKLVLQRFGNQMNQPQTLQLAQGSPNDELIIKYHHCGQAGKNRVLTVKDGQDKMLKEFRYADSKNTGGMLCKVKDIISLKRGNNSVLKLYYTSDEIPGGRLLASIVTASSTAAVQP
jgi:hypothetical protein